MSSLLAARSPTPCCSGQRATAPRPTASVRVKAVHTPTEVAPAGLESRRGSLIGLTTGVVTGLVAALPASAKPKAKPEPPKSEYEKMMESVAAKGTAPEEAALQKEFSRVKPDCVEYGGEVSSNYASGKGKYYDCKPSDRK